MSTVFILLCGSSSSLSDIGQSGKDACLAFGFACSYNNVGVLRLPRLMLGPRLLCFGKQLSNRSISVVGDGSPLSASTLKRRSNVHQVF